MKRTLILTLFVLLGLSTGLFAQTVGYAVGDQARDFDLPVVGGSRVALPAEDKGAIVVFTCNTCPYAKAYEDRIIALHDKYAPLGYPVIAINANDAKQSKGDSLEEMKRRSKDKKFPFPYAYDESQEVIKAYGGTRTPHIYLLENAGGKFFVRYIGAIDNNYQDASAVTERYVEAAIGELLQGKAVSLESTKAIGCTIKWKKAE